MRNSDVSAICQQCHLAFVRRFWAAHRPSPRFCSTKCAGQAKRVAVPKNPYPMIRANGSTVGLHRVVFLQHHGPGPHPCHWCGVSVIAMPGHKTKKGALVVDHLDNNPTNYHLSNLVPSCHRCNVRRTPQPQKPLATFICQVCGTTFTRVNQHRHDRPIRFCSRSCRFKGTGQ